ncbi:serine/threonine protein kinase with WD40 repeats [Oscillochloris trichoides DG-6]|uniref:Serine/threonine protein kinase with WD40 repeats n=1 Tax=Oscillochloris trichoides DG-6 TaxID=765420 RepID=E1ID97_9CHLR|nr:WD40 repeat domain-containing protein [Oscillochloris trichoides]EFO80774.1 serine/threonine protein kinase with WD40 repeats [Oscillochloris trichoides DG-6]
MLAPDSTLQDHYRITCLVDDHPDGAIYRAVDLRISLRVLIAESSQSAALLSAEEIAQVVAPSSLALHDHFMYANSVYLVIADPGGSDGEQEGAIRALQRLRAEVDQRVQRSCSVPLTTPLYGPPPPASPYAQPAPGIYAARSLMASASPVAAAPFSLARINTVALIGWGAGLTISVAVICFMGVFISYRPFAGMNLPMMGGEMVAGSVASSVTLSNPPAPTLGGVATTSASYSIVRQIEEADVGPVVYAPNGQMIAVGVGKVIQLRLGEALDVGPSLVGHQSTVSALAFSPDSRWLASSAQDEQEVLIWNATTGQERMRLQGHTGWVRSLAFSPDGTLLASGSIDTTVRLWDVATGRALGVLEGHTDYLGSIAFAPDGRRLASTARDGTVRVWDVATQQPVAGFAFRAPINPTTGAPYWLTGIDYSPDGTHIAVGSVSNSIYILDATTGQLLRELRGHKDWVVIRGLSYSPDGSTLASASTDGTLRLWDPITGSEQAVLTERSMRLLGFSWATDSQHLVTASDVGGALTVWNTQTRKIERTILLAQGVVTALAYSDSGAVLGSGGASGTVRLHILGDDRQVNINGGLPTNQFIAFLSDRELVAISDAGEVVIIDLSGQYRNHELAGLEGVAVSVVVSRDRKLIAAGSNTGQVVIWDAQTFKPIRTLSGVQGPAVLLAFNRDASRLAAATNADGSAAIHVWNAQSGTEQIVIPNPQTQITALDLTANGDMLVSASSNGKLTFWRTADGSEVRSINAPTNERWFSSVALSPNATLLVTGSLIGTLEFWDAQSGTRLGGISLATGQVMAMAFRPDGRQIAVSTFDGGIYLLETTE